MDALEMLLTEWKPRDLKMDAESGGGGYTPALGVVANRIASHYESLLLGIAQEVRPDAYLEYAPERAGRSFMVGFKDNRVAAAYNTAVQRVADIMRSLGWKVKLDALSFGGMHTLHVTLPAKIEQQAREVYPKYLQQLGKG